MGTGIDAGSRPAAVIVGLDCITGLQSARILARRGVPVIGIAANPRHYCCRTRLVRCVIGADTGGLALVEALEVLGPSLEHRAVVYPCTDASALMLARHRTRLAPWYHLALPDVDVLETLMDKTRFPAFAERIGVPLPLTRLLHERADAERAAAEMVFPCIVKPPVKTPRWQQHTTAKVIRVETPPDLLRVYDRCAPWADALMVQQWIDGPDSELYSCNCYYDRHGNAPITFVARKLRQWPPHTGTSCLGEECRNDAVLDLTLRLFGAAAFRGLGYLEVKRDVRTGAHYAIEANVGRPTGRSAIAETAGVELLFAMYCDLLDVPMPTARQSYGQAKWIFLRQDVRSALHDWKQGDLSLVEWARSLRGVRNDAVIAWSDPGPFVADIINLLTERCRPKQAAVTTVAAAASESPEGVVP